MVNTFLEHVYDAVTQSEGKYTLDDVLEMTKQAGVDGLECDYLRLGTLSTREEVKKQLDRHGLHVDSIYRTFDFGHASRETSEKAMDETLDMAAYYGTDKILAIPGFIEEGDDREEQLANMCKMLQIMCDKGNAMGIKIMLEDYDLYTSPCSTTAGLVHFMENVKGLYHAFDTGNYAYSLEDEMEAFEKLKGYICHVHLKDRSWDKATRANDTDTNGQKNIGGEVMYACEVGGGYIKIREIMALLKEMGYQGSYSGEHFGAKDHLQYILDSAKFIRTTLGME